jgi:hypothetical protein
MNPQMEFSPPKADQITQISSGLYTPESGWPFSHAEVGDGLPIEAGFGRF